MGSELRDFRGKITLETHIALEAETRVFGRDKTEIVRRVLHEWAARKLDEASVLTGLALAEGIGGNRVERRGGAVQQRGRR